jgi:hypothetical protein
LAATLPPRVTTVGGATAVTHGGWLSNLLNFSNGRIILQNNYKIYKNSKKQPSQRVEAKSATPSGLVKEDVLDEI